MATQTQTRSFGERLVGFIAALLRWLVVILAGVVLGAGLYYGATAAYTTVTDNTARINQLEQTFADDQVAVTAQFAQRDTRMATLEGDVITQGQQLNQMMPQVETLNEQLSALATRADTLGASLSTLESESAALGEAVITLEQNGSELSQSLTDIDLALFDAEDNVAQAQQEINALQRTALMVSAQGNILNAKQAIAERNAGTATIFVERASSTLGLAASLGDDGTTEGIQSLLTQLDTISAQLESDPFATESLLEGAWRSLDGLIVANLPAIEVDAMVIEGDPAADEASVEEAPAVEGDASTETEGAENEAASEAEGDGS